MTRTFSNGWDEPAGATPRGTVVVLPGRGETPASYERFGRRIAADAYRVRLVDVDLDDLDAARERVETLLADESLPSPTVLVGADTGATLAAGLLGRVGADGAVVAGMALGESTAGGTPTTWDEQVEARSACPVHRSVLASDPAFDRDALLRPTPWDSADVDAGGKPVLVLHGTADRITGPATVLAAWADVPSAQVRLVEGGRHDVLNDVAHRSVAASLVLFLESLRLGPHLPDVVVPADRSAHLPAPA